ncbi:MAG: MmgE/PrpD family protein [Actinomycetota bacterium]
MTLVEGLARWASELGYSDIPDDVKELCRAQRRSMLAAVAASDEDPATQRVLDAVEKNLPHGDMPFLLRDRHTTALTSIYGATVASMALDYDDYVCFGHTGHTSVLVPLLFARAAAASGKEQLVAQVVSNEIQARLGGACLLGPLNGQMWSFVHTAGTAIAAARLLRLDATQTAHALALSLYQAPRPVVPGFMSPDSKLLTAAEPATIGMRAALLAQSGVTGPLDVLDHHHGFLDAFSYAPLRAMLDGFGYGWATRTLSVKPYPGCAYLDTTLDALFELGRRDPDEIDCVEVHAGVLTCAMDRMSRPYADVDPPTPVTINFSVAWNVAIGLLAGRLTPQELGAGWLRQNRDRLRDIAARVTVIHDMSATRKTVDSMTNIVPVNLVRRELGAKKLVTAVMRARRDHPRVLSTTDLRTLGRTLSRPTIRHADRFWDPHALESFRMTFPARVCLRLKDGRHLDAEIATPRGAAGDSGEGPVGVARRKLFEFGGKMWRDVDAIERSVQSDADDIVSLLS